MTDHGQDSERRTTTAFSSTPPATGSDGVGMIAADEETVLDDIVIEDIVIDGMCGVY